MTTPSLDARAFRDGMATLNAGIRNAAHQALAIAVKTAEASAKETTLYKDRTGTLRSKTSSATAGLTGRLVADTPYAGFVEGGTRPHKIVARRGGTLAFQVAGEMHFARSVNHPGTAERPFMQVARDLGEQALDYGIDLMVSQAIERA